MIKLKFDVKAGAGVNLLLSFKKEKSKCNLYARSTMYATLRGSAKPSLADVAEAGIYVKGKFL